MQILNAFTLSIAFATSCQSNPAVIKANVDAEVFFLDPADGFQPLGKTPVELSGLSGTKIYQLRSSGYTSQKLILLESEHAEGTINVIFTKKSGDVNPESGLGRRLDQILKAHRAFLRGHVADAEEILKKVEKSQGADFGLLILKGNIAAIRGQMGEAVRYYKMASALYPEYNWGDIGK